MENGKLVKLIKACRQAGVSRLKHGELEIEFAAGDAVKPMKPPVESEVLPTDQELKEAEQDAAKAVIHDSIDEQLVTLQIDDPAQFEELLVQREFELGEAAHY